MALLEPLILFGVLFLPGIGFVASEPLAFSVNRELSRIVVYNIPSLALIWYMLRVNGGIRPERPGLRDLKTAFIAFPGLVLMGFCTALIPGGDVFSRLPLEPPRTFLQWAVLIPSILSSAYVEECYFRFYLLTRLEEAGISPLKGIFFSVLLFSLCHIYEGLPGGVNAALAGTFLSLLFLKYRSIHGLAWAHTAYNAAVYAVIYGWFGGS
ncbi:MAG: CPBP family intramembrane metalloprotease [Spirochaetaceae bacterium]|jgi:membrane protease YdiL (CAAX protease family)|nr:CPBP family intramembrane metalloprotease [Spirochaetaceae bacterium]